MERDTIPNYIPHFKVCFNCFPPPLATTQIDSGGTWYTRPSLILTSHIQAPFSIGHAGGAIAMENMDVKVHVGCTMIMT